MKGIAHFAVGVAAASCFPQAVQAGAGGDPLYFLLGGCCGLLPDTLDFKFTRFFARSDIEVTPDPLRPDPQLIADAVARAVNLAHAGGKPVSIKLNTIRLGADDWQQYTVRFDVPARRIVVSYGPVVDTGQNPVSAPTSRASAAAALLCPVSLDYEAATCVDILDGPFFSMEPTPDGRVIPRFIPWHRQWTHSLITALAAGLVCALVWGPLAGLVAFAAWAAHALLDQTGFMGNSLFYPLRKGRAPGLGLTHSSRGLPNLASVWLACLLVFWNIQRADRQAPRVNAMKYWAYGAVLPAAAVWFTRKQR
jgi:hypothetical protein